MADLISPYPRSVEHATWAQVESLTDELQLKDRPELLDTGMVNIAPANSGRRTLQTIGEVLACLQDVKANRELEKTNDR